MSTQSHSRQQLVHPPHCQRHVSAILGVTGSTKASKSLQREVGANDMVRRENVISQITPVLYRTTMASTCLYINSKPQGLANQGRESKSSTKTAPGRSLIRARKKYVQRDFGMSTSIALDSASLLTASRSKKLNEVNLSIIACRRGSSPRQKHDKPIHYGLLPFNRGACHP